MGHFLVIVAVVFMLRMAWLSATPLFRENCRLFYERNIKDSYYKGVLFLAFAAIAVYLSLLIANI